MSETMHCNRCNQTKLITEFPVRKTLDDGTKIYRTPCKKCKSTPKTKKITPILNKEAKNNHQAVTPDKNTADTINILTNGEIKLLKTFVKTLENKNTTNKSIIFEYKKALSNNKKSRIKTTYNLDVTLKNKLDDYCKSNKLNKSDVINLAINEFLKKIYP